MKLMEDLYEPSTMNHGQYSPIESSDFLNDITHANFFFSLLILNSLSILFIDHVSGSCARFDISNTEIFLIYTTHEKPNKI